MMLNRNSTWRPQTETQFYSRTFLSQYSIEDIDEMDSPKTLPVIEFWSLTISSINSFEVGLREKPGLVGGCGTASLNIHPLGTSSDQERHKW
jgi:hypothetical protein